MRPSKTAIALVVLLGGALLVVSSASGCSSDDDESVAADASTDANANVDADPCNTYTSVGKTCNIQPSRRCFPLCKTGGCFCQGGVWACITDDSCFVDSSFLDDDAGSTPIDASLPSDADASVDADAAD